MEIGIDLVEIEDFKNRAKTQDILEILFTPTELSIHTRTESLAGVFAAKEAFFKALGEKKDWHDVIIEKDSKGKPVLVSPLLSKEQKVSVSISHTDHYATATVAVYSP